MHIVKRAVHPSEIVRPDWFVSDTSLRSGALKIEHHLETADEISIRGFTHHTLSVTLNSDSNRQVTRIGNQEYDGDNVPGTFWLLAANDKPASWAWDGTDEAMMFIIDPLQLDRIASELGYDSSSVLKLENVTFGADARFVWLAKQFKAEMQQDGIGNRLYKESLGMLFITHLLREYSCQLPPLQRNSSGLGNKRLRIVLDYIDAHLAENIDLEQLAAIAELSKYHFSEMFKRSTGLPPYRYVLLQRIERAKYWLQKGNLPINEIALMCGFSDQSHLTKHFRKSVGMTPGSFRKQ